MFTFTYEIFFFLKYFNIFDTRNISRSVPRPYYFSFFRGERERAAPQKTFGTRISVSV